MEKYSGVEREDSSSLKYNICLGELDFLYDMKFIDLYLEICNNTEKPIFIEHKGLEVSAESNTLSKRVDFQLPKNKSNVEFLLHNGESKKFNRIKPYENKTCPTYFFNNNFQSYFEFTNEKVIDVCSEIEEFEIDFKIKNNLDGSIINKSIDRDYIVERLGELLDIDDYDKVIFLENI